jgi:hypothetical protein
MTCFTFAMTTVMRWKVEEARQGADDEARLCLLIEMTARFYIRARYNNPSRLANV